MKRKTFLLIMFTFCFGSIFAKTNSLGEPEMDVDFRWALPNING